MNKNLQKNYFKQYDPVSWYPILVFECINVPYNALNFTVGQEYYCLKAPEIISDDIILEYRIDIMDDNGDIHKLCPSNFKQLKKVYSYVHSVGDSPDCFEVGTLVSNGSTSKTLGEGRISRVAIEDIDGIGMIKLKGFSYYKSAWLLTCSKDGEDE